MPPRLLLAWLKDTASNLELSDINWPQRVSKKIRGPAGLPYTVQGVQALNSPWLWMRNTVWTIYRRWATSFTLAPVTQPWQRYNYSIAHPFLLLHMDTTVSSGWETVCPLEIKMCLMGFLSRGTKCIEADVKALHLESWGRTWSTCRWHHVSAACVNTWVLCQLHFHPHSIQWTNQS